MKELVSRPFVTRTISPFTKVWTFPSRLGFRGKVFGPLEEVQAKFGENVRVTCIACLVKAKADKSAKVRLIGDMLRFLCAGSCYHEGTSCLTQSCIPCESISWKLGRGTALSHGAWLTSLLGMGKASSLQQLTSQTLFSPCHWKKCVDQGKRMPVAICCLRPGCHDFWGGYDVPVDMERKRRLETVPGSETMMCNKLVSGMSKKGWGVKGCAKPTC